MFIVNYMCILHGVFIVNYMCILHGVFIVNYIVYTLYNIPILMHIVYWG